MEAGLTNCCDWFTAVSLPVQGFKGHRGEPGAPGTKVSVPRFSCIWTDQFASQTHHTKMHFLFFSTISLPNELQHLWGATVTFCLHTYCCSEGHWIMHLETSSAPQPWLQLEFRKGYTATVGCWHAALRCQDMSGTLHTPSLKESLHLLLCFSHGTHPQERFLPQRHDQ